MDNNQNINKMLTETYTEKSFGGATGLLAVREDPSRFISQADKLGIYNMFTEIIDNSLDEVREVITFLRSKEIQPPIKNIGVYLNNETGECVITDEGRGIPITPAKNHPDIPTMCAVFERDNMGSKGNKSGREEEGYMTKTMGTHGAGAFVVTACSKYMRVYTTRYSNENSKMETYYIEYNQGVPREEKDWIMGRVYKYPEAIQENTGTRIEFLPDTEIMHLYNPLTNQMEEDFYIINLIQDRIKDTLATYGDTYPTLVTLTIEGQEPEIYDSRELSIIRGMKENVDYVKINLSPDDMPSLAKEIKDSKVSDFNIEIYLLKDNTGKKVNSEGYVNRIRVNSSPHIREIDNIILNIFRMKAGADPDLKGFFDAPSLHGLKIVSLLEVDLAHWDGQVKQNYTDHRVSTFMGRLIALSGVLKEGYADEMLNIAFQESKPIMLLKKQHREQELEMSRRREEEAMRKENMKRNQNIVSESLTWLNLKDESLFFNGDTRNSTLLIVEGTSSSTNIKKVRADLPHIAVFDGMTGKIDNMRYSKTDILDMTLPEMEARNIAIKPVHKLDALLRAGFYRVCIMSDNDSDGDHIRALMRFYIIRRHPHLIEDGRVFEISPAYCSYRSDKERKYEYDGEMKTLSTTGTILTEREYNHIREAFPGEVYFTVYKGVGSMAPNDIKKLVSNESSWIHVPPLTDEEHHMMEEFFTDSSKMKRNYTSLMYSSPEIKRKDRVKTIIYQDTLPNAVDILGGLNLSTEIEPIPTRRTLEEYEELGSRIIEENELKNQMDEMMFGGLFNQ